MKKEFTLKSNRDNLSLSVFMMVPKNPIGIVQIAHGMTEHKERYYDFMEFLSTNGYITIINDHRGHGKSIKEADDLGYMYDDTSDYIVDDLHQVTEHIKKEYPDLPLTLLGQSMGSLIVRKYLKKYDKDIDKLIVCGSPSKNPLVNMGILLTKIDSALKGDHHRSNLINKMAFANNNKGIENPQSEYDWLCSNHDIVEEYDKDPLSGFIFTNNGFLNLFKLMKDVYSKNGWNIEKEKMPIFFIAGADDPVIINKKAWQKSIDFLKKIGYSNIKSKLYKNARHELLHEYNNNVVYKDILDFIEK